ncbi:PqiB family protein [Colwellia psychrerythraea]|uniref:Mammalian cell entry related domain protein n=1 Tax=Colwellia psychrerythraea TaxID=28229 RepID=A0A099L338_COLPS|nr:MlaD family protein [Colwellia psychrerythraea]KGJ97379.1 Mammalian cell entry related domain protein [Colwellia psychrerythraea]
MTDKKDIAASEHNQNINSHAEIVPRQGISIIWFVPFIALIFGLWLLIKVVSEQGTFITIEFDNGSGIVPNKTEIRYKGLITGLVKKVVPSDDLQRVIAEVEISKNFSDYLTQNTRFWLVSADISLQGVSGLDTLISGSYITILPDTSTNSDKQDHFIALTEAPTLDMSTPGLHLTLHTDVLGSISENSPISFKQIPIGYVTGYHYIESSKKIAINIFIKPEFSHLIKENSLFYNTSGVQVTASLSAGIKVNTDSLAAIMAGGISVDTLSYQEDLAVAKNGRAFPLHADFQSAEMGHEVELTLNWNSGIDHNAAILYQGLTIGVIESFSKIDPVSRKITATAKVNPRVVPYLTDQSQFYIVSPQINLTGLSNAKTLLTGSYISIRPSLAGKPRSKFTVFSNKPPYKYTEPGLHLMLTSNDRSSLQVGSNVYYKQQVVGNIQAIETTAPEHHLIHIHVLPEFSHYVNHNSRFYNNSGLKISASLLGVDIQAQSLQSILTGGIAFTSQGNNQDNQKKLIKNGDSFSLYADKKLAKQNISFTLNIAASEQVSTNTRVLYRGIEIGAIHRVNSQGDYQQLQLGLLPKYQHILKADTQFYLVKPSLSLSGASDTDALFGGTYITFNLGQGKKQRQFTLFNKPPVKLASASGLQLTLTTDHASVATPGSAISYRGITIGQVDNVSLNKAGDNIKVSITIDEEHRGLLKSTSRFYNASGISISGGLSDFVVKTESVDAILRGGISFYTPDSKLSNSLTKGIPVEELTSFTLFKHEEDAKGAGQAISIQFNDVTGLKVNTKVVYQEQTVGTIERLIFDTEKVGVTALVLLNDLGRQYAMQGTKFWKIEPQIGLVGSKNVAALLDGAFIGLLPTHDIKATPQHEFHALELAPTVEQLAYGLNIKLTTKRLGSVRVGNPILYRQIKVGKVIGIDLSPTADEVNIFINIAKRYSPLVNEQSQFWNTSGINIKAGIFSGVNIDSESIETLIAGGIAFATPELDEELDKRITSLPLSFVLHQHVDTDWLEWQPKIAIDKEHSAVE